MNEEITLRNLALKLRTPLVYILILVGIGMALVAVLADFLGIGGEQGIGVKQISLIGIGIFMIFTGFYLNSDRGRAFFYELVLPIESEIDVPPILILACWFGLLAGLVEVLIIAYREFYLTKFIDLSHHFTWMTPVSELILFLIPGLILFIIFKIRSNSNYLLPAVIIFSFLGFISILFMIPQLNDYASILLSIGLAIQLSRIVAKYTTRFNWVVRKTLPGIVSIVIVFGIYMIIMNP